MGSWMDEKGTSAEGASKSIFSRLAQCPLGVDGMRSEDLKIAIANIILLCVYMVGAVSK